MSKKHPKAAVNSANYRSNWRAGNKVQGGRDARTIALAYAETQKGCDLCSTPETKEDPFVWDHQHDLGCCNNYYCLNCIRGRIHRSCNLREGHLREAVLRGEAVLSESMQEYLTNPPFRQYASTVIYVTG